MKYKALLIGGDGELVLVLKDGNFEEKIRFSCMELVQNYCRKFNIDLPSNFRTGYKIKKYPVRGGMRV